MKRSNLSGIIIILLTFMVIIGAPFFGSIHIPASSLFTGELSQIFWSVRLPRVCLAFCVGAILALCGAVYQSIFKNPLASPYTLGVSSGAALGSTIGIMWFGGTFIFGFGSCVFGIGGALGTIMLVSWLSRSLKGDLHARLLLSGVILSFFFSSIILFLQYLGDFTQVFRVSRWLMGSVETVGYESLSILVVTAVVSFILLYIKGEELTVLSIGSEFAKTKGIESEKVVSYLFVVTSVAVGIVVSFCGPIGFVGIAVPYAARALGAIHVKQQLRTCFCLGGMLLAVCDTIGRTIIAPAEIPVGVITALLAAPLVMVLLTRSSPSSELS